MGPSVLLRLTIFVVLLLAVSVLNRDWRGKINRMPYRLLVACGVFLFLAVAAVAQEKEPINSDRPDFTDSPETVAKGALQLESGLTYQWARDSFSFVGPDGLLRYGLGHGRELRVGIPAFNWMRSDGVTTQGMGDGYLGAKFDFGPTMGGEWGLVAGATIPSRQAGFSSMGVDPDVELVWERDLGSRWGVGVMAHGTYTDDGDGRTWVGQGTVSFSRELNTQSDMFIEDAVSAARGSEPNHLVHFGVAYRPNPDLQVDFHFGWSLGSSDRQPFVGAGISKRF